jgi:hypothetical protein
MSYTITTDNGMASFVKVLDALREGVSRIGAARAVVGTNITYARYVIEGTQPHKISPRDKSALFWKGADHPFRSVMHPGTRANPFPEQALSSQAGAIDREIEAALSSVEAGAAQPDVVMRNGLLRAGYAVQAEIQRRTPVVTGTFRRSWYTEVVG